MKSDGKTKAKVTKSTKIDGFTAEDLKNELKHLGLTETFPEIEEHAEMIYQKIDKVKKERILRTCDLYDAIEQCQLICILNRIPNYKIFLHNQKGCERVPGLCEDCEKKKEVLKTSEIQNSMSKLKIRKVRAKKSQAAPQIFTKK